MKKFRKILIALTFSMAALTTAEALAEGGLSIPKRYRTWFHVNTAIIDKASPLFEMLGGMHNVSINPTGLRALKSGAMYPDGSIFVDDIHEFTLQDGVYNEGPRKAIAIMVKDETLYAATGGWGFQLWAGGDPKKPIVTDSASQCFACHQQQKDHQFVFSTYIP
jgi:hypothetical protein